MTGPVQVTGEVLGVKRLGALVRLTFVAGGVAERFRPGTFVAFAVGGPLSDRLLRRLVPLHAVRVTGAYGATAEVVLEPPVDRPADPGWNWLTGLPAGAPLDVLGPLGRPYALPKEPVTCVLVGEGAASAPLFALAERLRDRNCAVHMVLGGRTEAHLFGALEARRATRGVTVTTEDGSVGIAGRPDGPLPDLLRRTGAEVVYGAGRPDLLHAVARVAEHHGAWSQTAVPLDVGCGTGLCGACVLPVVSADGITRMARGCTEGPVFRGDRVRWDDLEPVARVG
jgi:dihydroorotate dehydrogenase electron transfer subunit